MVPVVAGHAVNFDGANKALSLVQACAAAKAIVVDFSVWQPQHAF
jgi:hypothetical protein